MSPIADINFFVALSDSSINYSDQQLSGIIQANNYKRVKDSIDKFKERCLNQLSTAKERVDEKKLDLKAAEDKVSRNEPGNGPSDLFLNRSDQGSINRYNEKVERHNHQVELYRRYIDQRDRARERYDDALDSYKEKEADIQEQILEREEALKPALDSDMVAFLGKLQQLVNDCLHNKSLIFESFILLFMAKVSYVFLYDRIESASDRSNANNIFTNLQRELDLLVKGHQDAIKQGFIDMVEYVNDVFKTNENTFNDMQILLNELPYDVCSENEEPAEAFIALDVDTNFQYQDIIDPSLLAKVSAQIHQRRDAFSSKKKDIDEFVMNLSEVFEKIYSILLQSKDQLHRMHENKDKNLGEAFEHAQFILGVFEESVQDQYLKNQQDIFEEIQLDIETAMGVNLPQLLSIILTTKLLTVSAEEAISNNPNFDFLDMKPKLVDKSKSFHAGIKELDSQLTEIDQQPKKHAEEFRGKAQKLLVASVLPIGNLVALFPIHQELNRFAPALESQNPIYTDLRKSLSSKFNSFFIVHTVVAVLIAGSIFAVHNRQKPLIGLLASTYAASSGYLYTKKKQLLN